MFVAAEEEEEEEEEGRDAIGQDKNWLVTTTNDTRVNRTRVGDVSDTCF
jgi:hypothetical protein